MIKSDIVRGRRGDTEAKNSEKSPDVLLQASVCGEFITYVARYGRHQEANLVGGFSHIHTAASHTQSHCLDLYLEVPGTGIFLSITYYYLWLCHVVFFRDEKHERQTSLKYDRLVHVVLSPTQGLE